MFFILLLQAFRYAISGLIVVEFKPGTHRVTQEIAELMQESGAGEALAEHPSELHEKITHCLLGNPLTQDQIEFLHGQDDLVPVTQTDQPQILTVEGVPLNDLFTGDQLSAIATEIIENELEKTDLFGEANEPNTDELPHQTLETTAEQSENAEPAAEPSAENSTAKPAKSHKKHA